MFSYSGNHGPGDSARIPVAHQRAIQQTDGMQPYIQDEEPVAALSIDRFAITDQYIYGLTGKQNENYDGSFFVYHLVNNSVTTFKDASVFLEFLTINGLNPQPDYHDFNYHYDKHWHGWRFWLLP